MWTDENRARYDRSQLRYPSDLTDAEWDLVRPCIPPCKRGGRQRWVDLREVVNGVMYVLSTGRQGRAVPKALPPGSAVQDFLGLGEGAGPRGNSPRALSPPCRGKVGPQASPTAAIIDSQSGKSAEKGGL